MVVPKDANDMQTHQVTVTGFAGYFPSADSYNLIFLTATIISMVSIVLAVILWRVVPKHHPNAV